MSVSFEAFLFSLSNKEGTKRIFYLNPEKRFKAHFMNQSHGPTFGEGDLVLDTMWTGSSQLGNSFGISADVGFHFVDAANFAVSDVEVLYLGGKYFFCYRGNYYLLHYDELTVCGNYCRVHLEAKEGRLRYM